MPLFERFFVSGSFKSAWSSTKPLNLGSVVTYRTPTPDTHGYPGVGGVVFSIDPGQLRVRSVSVRLGGGLASNHIINCKAFGNICPLLYLMTVLNLMIWTIRDCRTKTKNSLKNYVDWILKFDFLRRKLSEQGFQFTKRTRSWSWLAFSRVSSSSWRTENDMGSWGPFTLVFIENLTKLSFYSSGTTLIHI